MLGKTFYHSFTRKYISIFGNLFNDIYVRRSDKNGNTVQTIPVPIQYAPMASWLAVLNRHPQDNQVSVQLPRIGFELTGMSRNPVRQKSSTNKIVELTKDNKIVSSFMYQTYDLNITMYVACKNMDEACQISEQIIPYFTPDFPVSAKLFPDSDTSFDISVRLDGQSLEDTYSADLLTRRTIIWVFNFTIEALYLGPIKPQGLIKRVQTDLHAVSGNISDYQNSSRNERLVLTPGLTEDGKPTSDKDSSIQYLLIEPDDDYGFVEETFTFNDGKIYDPKTGKDI